jgi:hypothetical protein
MIQHFHFLIQVLRCQNLSPQMYYEYEICMAAPVLNKY